MPWFAQSRPSIPSQSTIALLRGRHVSIADLPSRHGISALRLTRELLSNLTVSRMRLSAFAHSRVSACHAVPVPELTRLNVNLARLIIEYILLSRLPRILPGRTVIFDGNGVA